MLLLLQKYEDSAQNHHSARIATIRLTAVSIFPRFSTSETVSLNVSPVTGDGPPRSKGQILVISLSTPRCLSSGASGRPLGWRRYAPSGGCPPGVTVAPVGSVEVLEEFTKFTMSLTKFYYEYLYKPLLCLYIPLRSLPNWFTDVYEVYYEFYYEYLWFVPLLPNWFTARLQGCCTEFLCTF